MENAPDGNDRGTSPFQSAPTSPGSASGVSSDAELGGASSAPQSPQALPDLQQAVHDLKVGLVPFFDGQEAALGALGALDLDGSRARFPLLLSHVLGSEFKLKGPALAAAEAAVRFAAAYVKNGGLLQAAPKSDTPQGAVAENWLKILETEFPALRNLQVGGSYPFATPHVIVSGGNTFTLQFPTVSREARAASWYETGRSVDGRYYPESRSIH